MIIVYDLNDLPTMLALSGFVLFFLLYALTAMIFAAYVPEIFPTRLRLTGSGISSASGRLANVIVPFAVAGLLNSMGPRSVYYASSFVLVFQAFAVLTLGEETRGRSLEEIEEMAAPAA